MLYLASQFGWFLAAAFCVGWIMGWLGSERRIALASGPMPYLAAIWLLLAVLTWLQGVNGTAAFWVETGLLFLAAYLAGCVLSSAVRELTPRRTVAIAAVGPAVSMDATSPEPEAKPSAPEEAVAAPAAATLPVETEGAAIGSAAPVATEDAAKPKTRRGTGKPRKTRRTRTTS